MFRRLNLSSGKMGRWKKITQCKPRDRS